MKKLCTLALIALSSFTYAAGTTPDSACMAAAKDKKLFGAARTSFVTKCEKDVSAKCELAAGEKKLAGAARTSNVKKCVRETAPAA